jgi:hypothetical protein
MPPSFAMEELVRGIKIILNYTKDNSTMWKAAMNIFMICRLTKIWNEMQIYASNKKLHK